MLRPVEFVSPDILHHCQYNSCDGRFQAPKTAGSMERSSINGKGANTTFAHDYNCPWQNESSTSSEAWMSNLLTHHFVPYVACHTSMALPSLDIILLSCVTCLVTLRVVTEWNHSFQHILRLREEYRLDFKGFRIFTCWVHVFNHNMPDDIWLLLQSLEYQ